MSWTAAWICFAVFYVFGVLTGTALGCAIAKSKARI